MLVARLAAKQLVPMRAHAEMVLKPRITVLQAKVDSLMQLAVEAGIADP